LQAPENQNKETQQNSRFSLHLSENGRKNGIELPSKAIPTKTKFQKEAF
jgi:hypothetical protein